MTIDENGKKRPTHERLLKAERSLLKLIRENTIFTYLDDDLKRDFSPPSMNNRIEGGVNSRLREMLRNHRGLSIERRIKAVYWWCYMHSPEPLSLSEILNIMPTDKSIAAIYKKMSEKQKLEKIFRYGEMLLFGVTFIRWTDSMINGISHQHVLSYNPEFKRGCRIKCDSPFLPVWMV